MEDGVKKAINEIRPQIQVHGGDVELINVENGVVKVRLTGACAGCPMSQMTLKHLIEGYLKQRLPGIRSVEAV